MSSTSTIREASHYIGGAWRSSEGAAGVPVENPATEETITEIPIATESEVDEALEAASTATA